MFSFFFSKSTLIFTLCYVQFAGRLKKASFQGFWEAKMEDQVGTSGRQVLSVCGVVCVCGPVETVKECQMRVNDVFCAVSLSGTTTASSSTAANPVPSQSSCCPFQRLPSFQWRTAPVRQRPIRRKMLVNTWNLEHMDLVS